MRILAAQINPTIGDLEKNSRKVMSALKRAKERRVDIVVFPELTLCGYFPGDLLLDSAFIRAMAKKLREIEPETQGLFVAVGLARKSVAGQGKPLHNSAAVFADGKLLGFKDKTLLPTYDVFDERRYFEPGTEEPVWEYRGQKIAVTICEDVWQHAKALDGYVNYENDPILELKGKKPDLLLNLSGSPYHFRKKERRLAVFEAAAKTLGCPVVFCNQVGANDSLVFDGHSFFMDAKGKLIQMAHGFQEEDLITGEKGALPKDPIQDLYAALVLGVRDYFHKQGFQKALLGLSGGIDSALVACIAKEALGAENVLALSMPSRFSSKGSVEDSVELAKILGIELIQVSIESLFEKYLAVLSVLFKPEDLTEQNLQSRIRGMILMAFSNQTGAILLNTGNKSEMALGYCTLYGDMAGGLGVLQDVTKLKIYELARHIQIIPEAILKKAPSAELKENQADSDTFPPYEILDPIIEDYVEKRLSPPEIAKKRGHAVDFVLSIVHKIHVNEYKRRQAPIGIRVTEKAFNPGRVMPIVQKWM